MTTVGHLPRTTVEHLLTGVAVPLPDGRGATGIDKHPRPGRLRLTPTGLDTDEQGDPRHHGGPEKALHHYARDHYERWQLWAPDLDLWGRPGAFGENISTTGLTEDDVHVGDVFTLGTATLQVSQGRQPCWKLDVRTGRRGTARRMQETGATGWYYRVLVPGHVAAGDELVLRDRPEPDWPLSRVVRAMFDRAGGPQEWAAAARIPTLAERWRTTLAARLDRGVEDWSARLDGRPDGGP